MTDRLIYANTRAITKETTLFSKERLSRMIETENLDSAVKILYEVGYGGGIALSSPYLFEELLAEEERRANAFLNEVTQSGFGLECFSLKNDYHNAKVLLKASRMNIDGGFMTMPEGVYPFEKLKAILLEGKKGINPYLDQAMAVIERLEAEGKLIPRHIDTLIDKALFEDIAERLKKVKDKAVKEYFKALSDCTNLLSMLRVKRIGEKPAFLEDCFVCGGSISLHDLTALLDKEEGDVKKALGAFGYPELQKFPDNFSELEAAIDNYLIKIFKERASDVHSAAPLISYYLQKLNEIKMIRIVLVCLKNKVNIKEINKRMRVIYA